MVLITLTNWLVAAIAARYSAQWLAKHLELPALRRDDDGGGRRRLGEDDVVAVPVGFHAVGHKLPKEPRSRPARPSASTGRSRRTPCRTGRPAAHW